MQIPVPFLERKRGFEPQSSIWKIDALPLCYLRKLLIK